MNLVSVAVAQLDLRDGDYGYNFDQLARTVAQLAPRHDLIVLPETVTTGFASRADVEPHAEPPDGPTVTHLRRWSAAHGTTIVCGLAERASNGLYNSAVVVSHGDLVFIHRKVQLWPGEMGLFEPGDVVLHTAPWCGTRLGALICFDIEFPELARAVAATGGGLLCVCDGNMHPYGPPQRSLAIARAIENQMFVLVANRVGWGKNDHFAGGSLIVSPSGQIIAEAGGEAEAIISATLDLGEIDAARGRFDYIALRRLGFAEPTQLSTVHGPDQGIGGLSTVTPRPESIPFT